MPQGAGHRANGIGFAFDLAYGNKKEMVLLTIR